MGISIMLRPDRAIAAYFGLSPRQFRRRLAYTNNGLWKVLQEGRQGAAVVWSRRLHEKAEKGNVNAMAALLSRAESLGGEPIPTIRRRGKGRKG